jgi:hypothetical protein
MYHGNNEELRGGDLSQVFSGLQVIGSLKALQVEQGQDEGAR